MFYMLNDTLKCAQERGFVEALTRAMLNPSRFQEVATVCMLDICRAASRVKPGDYESPLRSIAADIAHDIRVRIASDDRVSRWTNRFVVANVGQVGEHTAVE
jgi:hypothetical protein